MRHQKARKRMGSSSSHRKAILRNMVTSLFKHGQIETTDARARQIRPVAERMITLAKRGDLHARRQALSFIREKAVTHRLFGEIKDRYLDRPGGYTRILKTRTRRGDGAAVSVVQLLPVEEEKKRGKRKAKAPSDTKAKTPEVSPPAPEKQASPPPAVEPTGGEEDTREGSAEETPS